MHTLTGRPHNRDGYLMHSLFTATGHAHSSAKNGAADSWRRVAASTVSGIGLLYHYHAPPTVDGVYTVMTIH